MPLFDLFKKSPKKEPIKEDPFGSPEVQKKRYDAAVEFLRVLQENFLSSDGKAHAGTVLSAAAWLAGTSLYRALNYKHNPAPGTVVLSNEVNEVGPKLMNLFMYYCERNGISLKSDQLVLKTPDEHKPQMEILQVQEKFQDRYNEIMKKHGLDYLDGAKAGMIVCSIVFQYHCARVKDIEPNTAAGIVSMGVVEGAKTAPPPLGLGNSMDTISEKRVKNNNRLVLGERDVAIQEALDHGGVFIDLNPEVLRTLQASNIDLYLIYEKAMLNQIEAKIPRIDFVKTNVDELFEEWKSKPHAQAPIHVRLILWLKNNASTHRYEQRENSWVLNNR
jgi:hypothetical protein